MPPPPRRPDQPRADKGTGEVLLSQAEVEREMARISAAMEDATNQLVQAGDDMAEAHVDYKLKLARRMAYWKMQPGNGPKGRTTDVEAEAKAKDELEAEYRLYHTTEARYRSLKEVLASQRSRLDSLRTIAVNIRAQT